jgi:hypothetical protein
MSFGCARTTGSLLSAARTIRYLRTRAFKKDVLCIPHGNSKHRIELCREGASHVPLHDHLCMQLVARGHGMQHILQSGRLKNQETNARSSTAPTLWTEDEPHHCSASIRCGGPEEPLGRWSKIAPPVSKVRKHPGSTSMIQAPVKHVELVSACTSAIELSFGAAGVIGRALTGHDSVLQGSGSLETVSIAQAIGVTVGLAPVRIPERSHSCCSRHS